MLKCGAVCARWSAFLLSWHKVATPSPGLAVCCVVQGDNLSIRCRGWPPMLALRLEQRPAGCTADGTRAGGLKDSSCFSCRGL